MYEVIYKDVILFKSPSKQKAKEAIETYATKRGLEFWQEISCRKRADYMFYNKHCPNIIETYTIIAE